MESATPELEEATAPWKECATCKEREARQGVAAQREAQEVRLALLRD